MIIVITSGNFQEGKDMFSHHCLVLSRNAHINGQMHLYSLEEDGLDSIGNTSSQMGSCDGLAIAMSLCNHALPGPQFGFVP